MHDLYHQVIVLYQSVPGSVWQLIGSALVVSGVVQALKHKFFEDFSPAALVSITTGLSFLAGLVQYFGQAVHTNPGVLGVHTAAIFAGTQWAYRYLISPLYKLFVDAQAHRADTNSAATTAVMTPEADI